MAGGAPLPAAASSRAADYSSNKLTFAVVVVALLAASGGLLFGYDIGVTGGVTSMPEFQQKFFPDVYAATQAPADSSNPYW